MNLTTKRSLQKEGKKESQSRARTHVRTCALSGMPSIFRRPTAPFKSVFHVKILSENTVIFINGATNRNALWIYWIFTANSTQIYRCFRLCSIKDLSPWFMYSYMTQTPSMSAPKPTAIFHSLHPVQTPEWKTNLNCPTHYFYSFASQDLETLN